MLSSGEVQRLAAVIFFWGGAEFLRRGGNALCALPRTSETAKNGLTDAQQRVTTVICDVQLRVPIVNSGRHYDSHDISLPI